MEVHKSILKTCGIIVCIFFLLSLLLLNSCTTKENKLSQYLENVEIHYENDSQKAVIIEVLHDLATLPPNQLKQKKYPNYTGKVEQWDCTTVLSKYFVPDHSSKKLSEDFYHELQSNIVQQQIRVLIIQIEKGNTH